MRLSARLGQTLAFCAFTSLAGCGDAPTLTPAPENGPEVLSPALKAGPTKTARIFFPDSSGGLAEEPREVSWSDDPTRFAQAILEQLVAGPTAPEHLRVFPEDVSIGNIVIEAGGRIYADFESEHYPTPPPSGSHDEFLTVYSVVNSLTLNIDSVRSVVILWNGRQPLTFGGHVDTSRPLLPQTDLNP